MDRSWLLTPNPQCPNFDHSQTDTDPQKIGQISPAMPPSIDDESSFSFSPPPLRTDARIGAHSFHRRTVPHSPRYLYMQPHHRPTGPLSNSALTASPVRPRSPSSASPPLNRRAMTWSRKGTQLVRERTPLQLRERTPLHLRERKVTQEQPRSQQSGSSHLLEQKNQLIKVVQ